MDDDDDVRPVQRIPLAKTSKTSDAFKELETAVDALLKALEKCRQNEQRMQEILSRRDKT